MSSATYRPGCGGQIAILAVGFIMGCIVGLSIDGIGQLTSRRRAQFVEERDAVAPAIAKDPAFKDVHIDEDSEGFAQVAGKVPTADDKDRLQEAITRALGQRHAERSLHVTVEP
jgi:hypothetical protein